MEWLNSDLKKAGEYFWPAPTPGPWHRVLQELSATAGLIRWVNEIPSRNLYLFGEKDAFSQIVSLSSWAPIIVLVSTFSGENLTRFGMHNTLHIIMWKCIMMHNCENYQRVDVEQKKTTTTTKKMMYVNIAVAPVNDCCIIITVSMTTAELSDFHWVISLVIALDTVLCPCQLLMPDCITITTHWNMNNWTQASAEWSWTFRGKIIIQQFKSLAVIPRPAARSKYRIGTVMYRNHSAWRKTPYTEREGLNAKDWQKKYSKQHNY